MLKRMLNRAKTSDRVDDNVETFAKRYQGFVDESSKVISVFRAQEILIRVRAFHAKKLDSLSDHSSFSWIVNVHLPRFTEVFGRW